MATKRASKRKRKNPNDPHPIKEENEQNPPQAKIVKEGDSEKSIEESGKKEIEKESPVIVLAHGAGAPSSSDWIIRWRLFTLTPFPYIYLYFTLFLVHAFIS